ncbi:MAG: ATP-binding protein [Isosphaeraceae bacterium]
MTIPIREIPRKWRPRVPPLLMVLASLSFFPFALAAAPDNTRRILVLYPVSDGQPGIFFHDQGLRSTFKASSEHIVLYNEYLDSVRFPDGEHQRRLAEFLRDKYAGTKIDLVISPLAPSLDFVLKYRDVFAPGIPVVFSVIEQRELKDRDLGPGIAGVPMRIEMEPILEQALRLHPQSRRVAVVAGKSRTDAYWAAEARKTFRRHENQVEFVYLVGLPMSDLLREAAHLPGGSIVYYLHVFEDGLGETFIPAEVVDTLSKAANAPVYGHYRTYLGRGIVGGRLVDFEAEGAKAAKLALRILGGEKPEHIVSPGTVDDPFTFDRRQLQKWGISEQSLPAGSVVLYKSPSFWELYKWHITSVISLCVVEALLILGLLMERARRRRAERGLRQSQRELRALTGRLIHAQEEERRRIARELHDDLNQSLALLAIELDLLAQMPPESDALLGDRLHGLSGRVKQLSSAVHDLSHLLHPSKLEQLGLVASIRGLCKELARDHELAIQFVDQQLPPSIPADAALCLYRIAQEALQNVLKHSGAQHARVDLLGSEDAVVLRITDEGAGFDPGSVGEKGGLGLVSMRERLHILGGTIVINSRPGEGTRIDVRLPLNTSGAGQKEQALRTGPSGVRCV